MKKFLISLLLLLSLWFIADRIGGWIMWKVNQETQDIPGPKLHYLTHDIDEDIILLGTSRCNCHYVPSIIADSLGMSTFNAGINASENIYNHYIALNLILTHHTPKVVCLDVRTTDYACEPDPFAVIGFLAPCIGYSRQADSVFMDAGKYWPYQLCHLYRYNAKALTNIKGLFETEPMETDGYYALPYPSHTPDRLDTLPKPARVDSLKTSYLRRFIERCQSRNIEVVFVVSPAYLIPDGDIYGPLRTIAAEYDVPFFDYHSRGMFLDHPEYFKDENHLWDKSARLFTSTFAHDLKNYLIAQGMLPPAK